MSRGKRHKNLNRRPGILVGFQPTLRTMSLKIGTLFEITLKNNQKAVGHYVFSDKNNGPLIQVFDFVADSGKLIIADAIQHPYMFPPVITGLKSAIRSGLWSIIGFKNVVEFQYPKFIQYYANEKTGEVKKWFLYDGNISIDIGPILDERYKHLEFLVVWSPFDIIFRIETGTLPFPYEDMKKHNKYIPIKNNERE